MDTGGVYYTVAPLVLIVLFIVVFIHEARELERQEQRERDGE